MRTAFSSGAVCLAVVALAALPAWAGEFNSVVSIGDPMPEFQSLPSTKGTRISSSDLAEDVVVLVFLANHCPWVQGMDSDLVDLVEEMDGRSAAFVGVGVNLLEQDLLPAMREHAEKVGYNFPYVFDGSQELGRKLGAARTPEYYVFDKERKLVYMGLLHNSPASMNSQGEVKYSKGEPTRHYVRDAILAALSGEPVEVTETRSLGCNIQYQNP